MKAALDKVPAARLSEDERKWKKELEHQPEMTIFQLIYQQQSYEGHAKDHEFSGTSMREHWTTGFEDTHRTLNRKEWLVIPPAGAGIVVYNVHREYDRWREDGQY